MEKYAAVFGLLSGLLACQLIMFRNHYLTFTWWSQVLGSFPGCTVVKNLLANAGDARVTVSIPGSERLPGGGNCSSLQCSCLENFMDRGAWQATTNGVTKSVTQLSMHAWTQALECFTKYVQSKSKSNCRSLSN